MMQPAASRSAALHDRPRFRQDLIAELIDEQGARFIDVMDPDSGNLFRFYEVEYSLACGMDGERDVPGIVKWAQEELGLTPSHQEVRSVIATLSDLGFIDTAGEDLAAGVVAAAPGRAPAASVDLGSAGGFAASAPSLPRPSDLALGAAGAAARRQAEPVEDVALGASGRGPARITPSPGPAPGASAGSGPWAGGAAPRSAPGPTPAPPPSADVSLDLADQFAVRPSDVQEAVRASRVMAAVDPALLDTLDSIEDRPTAKAPQPERLERPPELLRPPDARATEKEMRVGKAPLTRQPSSKLPVELPRPPAPATGEHARIPTQAPSRVSPFLVMLLIVAVIGGGAYLVWKYVLDRPATVGTISQPVTPPVPPAPPPPPPPPAPVAKIVMDVPAPDEVKTGRAGTIETIVADKSAVKAGDVVVKLVGDKPIEAELSALARDQKRLQDQIDVYTKRRDAARDAGNKAAEGAAQNEIETRQKTLAGKTQQLADKTLQLDKFLLHAPSTGAFEPKVKLGQKVAAEDVVATIQRDATPIATFKVSDVKPFTLSAPIEIGLGKGELRVPCSIAGIATDTVKVACPVDPALTDGAEVTLKVPVAAPAPPAGTPGEAAGSPGAPPTTPPPTPAVPGSAAEPSSAGSAQIEPAPVAPAAGAEAPAAPAAPKNP